MIAWRVFCNSVIVGIHYVRCAHIDHCSLGTVVQHGESDPFLGPPHSERAFQPVKLSASARDLQEAEKNKIIALTCTTQQIKNG